MRQKLSIALLFSGLFITTWGCQSPGNQATDLQFQVSFEGKESESFDGRLLLLLSTSPDAEPRFQIADNYNTQIVFGIDVDGMAPGQKVTFDHTVFGYPVANFGQLAPGEYYVQALLHKYETFSLQTGHTVKLPMHRGAGQQWNREPGNLYSKPQKINIDPVKGGSFQISMDQEIPPITPPEDTKYIKHIQMKSKLLSDFWGRDMYLGAHILLPEGFDEHPEARYPLAIFHGHYPDDFGGFRTSPPDPDLKPDYSERFKVEGYNIIQQQEAYDFYKKWTSPDFPRFLIVEIQHPTPYYDDSYAVNSASQGPYGDALTYELIPYIEEQFRGIGQGWARFLYGGSTGGWEALAVQIMYPDEYNGCFAACPDPIDFRAYTLINLYEQKNAYTFDGPHTGVEIPAHRNYLGEISSTVRSNNYKELVLGTKGRSGQQWDIWQAVYSPQGEDGYPKPIWDKMTGEIDAEVAQYWKENYDLRFILERDWATLGPKLKGKIHIYCGDMDNFYLNNAVYLMEEFLENTTNPHYEGEVTYGDRDEHCWNGDPENPNYLTRLRYNTLYVPKILKRIEAAAPPNADTKSWKY